MSTTVKRPEMPDPEGTEKTRTGITAFITRHAVATYYALAFAISWGGILLILGPDGLFSTGATMPLAGGAAQLDQFIGRRVLATVHGPRTGGVAGRGATGDPTGEPSDGVRALAALRAGRRQPDRDRPGQRHHTKPNPPRTIPATRKHSSAAKCLP
jgi:hypothetical protein